MQRVSADPKTFEMRRDIRIELKQYRMKTLKREFSEQIKLLEVKEHISKQLLKSKLLQLNQNSKLLAEKDGQEKMEKILGFRLLLISEKNEDLMYDILQNP